MRAATYFVYLTWPDLSWPDLTRPDLTWPDSTWTDQTRPDPTWPDLTCLLFTAGRESNCGVPRSAHCGVPPLPQPLHPCKHRPCCACRPLPGGRVRVRGGRCFLGWHPQGLHWSARDQAAEEARDGNVSDWTMTSINEDCLLDRFKGTHFCLLSLSITAFFFFFFFFFCCCCCCCFWCCLPYIYVPWAHLRKSAPITHYYYYDYY